MYSSGYSQVSRYSPPSQKKMQYRSKGKSCGYYMRIVFFFSSLIQSLIIVSLVLFLVYGKTQDSASTSRIQDLEESFSRLSIENVALKQQRTNLTNLLNATLTEKARNDFDLTRLRFVSNMSILFFEEYERKLQQCKGELLVYQMGGYNNKCPQMATIPGNCNCGLLGQQMQASLALAQSNFTQTVQRMRMDMDRTAKERDNLSLETIRLRRDKSKFEKELEIYRQTSKDEFTHSLRSVSNVSRAFLQKIESLFPTHIAFQITCPKQREHLEQIRNNCTSLSREVEDRLQRYMDVVGDHVTGIQAENSRLKAENWRLSEDYRWCGQNRTGMIVQHKQNMDRLQQKHDNDKETLLTEKMNLIGEIKVLENNVIYKSKTVDHLTEQIKQLNMSCMAKAGPGGSGFPGLVPSRSGTQSQPASVLIGGGGSNSLGRASTGGFGSNFGSSGSSFNKPSTTGTGTGSSFSSSGSSPGLGSSLPGLNKPASSGGAFSGFGSSSSSTSLSSSVFGANKPAVVPKSSSSFGSTFGSTGSGTSLSSSNTGSNKQTSSSASSSGSSLSTGAGTGYGSSGYGSNKQTSSSGKSSSPFGYGSSSSGSSVSSSSSGSPSSSGSSGTSTGSNNKGGSSSTNWFGFGSSNSGQSKPGSVPGRSPSSSGAGSFSGGRTNELEGGRLNRHIQEIKLLISPPGPDSNKQDVSSMLG